MEILSFRAVHYPTKRVFHLLDENDVSDLIKLINEEEWQQTISITIDRKNTTPLEEKDYRYLNTALELYWTQGLKNKNDAVLFLKSALRLTDREQQFIVLVMLLEVTAFSVNPAYAIQMTLCHDAAFVPGTTPEEVGKELFLSHFTHSDEFPESWAPYWKDMELAETFSLVFPRGAGGLEYVLSSFRDDNGNIDCPRILFALFCGKLPSQLSKESRNRLLQFFDSDRFGNDLMRSYETLKSERFNGTVFMPSKEKVPLVQIC
jgi:hypothetical protein